MKILFVIRDMYMGGAGKQLSMLASALSKKKHDVYIYTYVGASLEHKLPEKVIYLAENTPPRNKLSEYIFTPRNIRKVVKCINPNVVVSWRANAGCMTVLACLGLKTKVIFSERSDPYMETSLLLKMATYICTFSNGGVFQTSEARNYYKRIASKSIVLPNPVELSENSNFKDINKSADSIIWIGRIKNSQKRLDILLKSFQLINKKKPHIILSIYGDGPDLSEVRELASSLGIIDNVKFCGITDSSILKIGEHALLLLSSDYEGIPNVIIEAFIAGTPVVSTDCSPGGARVLIEDGDNGFIVPIGDYKLMAQKACEVLGNKTLSEQFVQKSRIRLKKFDSKIIFKKWEQYIKDIADGL